MADRLVATTREELHMSVATITNQRPTRHDIIEDVEPLVVAPAFFGPPVVFLLGPWMLLVLLIIPPAAVLITFVLVFAVVIVALVAIFALLASPYLLVRHLRARYASSQRRSALPRRRAGAVPRVASSARSHSVVASS
jgi:hypothetical protein